VKSFSRLFLFSIILIAAACAPKKAEMPFFEERGIEAMLAERRAIERIDTTFGVVFEKADSEMHGDAVLDITREGDLHLQVYTLGILGMDLTSKNGVVRSTPNLDRNRKAILTQGLRDGLFWWDMQDYTVRDEGEYVIMQNATRTLWLDRKTMFPAKQKMDFDDGKQLTVLYDSPAREKEIWYPAKMRLELPRYAVTLTVKGISFTKRD
jgi:hypothetical protein